MLTVTHALKLSRKKFVRNVRSDGRLKKYDSITDERAWTLDKYERQHYIRDYIAAPYGSSKTGQNQGCEDKLPLHMLIGALLSAKNQLLDDLQDQLHELSNTLAECKDDLNTCTDGTQRSKPSDEDSKILYKRTKSKEETTIIETEDGIFKDTNLEYSTETSEIPAYELEDDKNGGMEDDENSSGGSSCDEDNYEHMPGETDIDDCLGGSGMPQDSPECTDSDDSFEFDDPVSGSYGRKGVRDCEQDELKVYMNICDDDTDGQAKEVYLGSLRLPKSSAAAAKQTGTPRSMSRYPMRYNGSYHGKRTQDDPCQPRAKYSRNRRSRSAGSRPSSPCDYQRQHEMIQKLNYYGNCQEYPSTANTPQSSSLDEFLSPYEQDCPPSTVDDDFHGSRNRPCTRNTHKSANYYPPSDTMNSQKSFPTTEKTRPCNPSTRQRRRESKKKYTSKSIHNQPHYEHSYYPCTEKVRPKTSSGVSPYDSYPTTPPHRRQLEEFGINNDDENYMNDPETAITKKPSQATQTDLTCSDIRELGMMNDKDIEGFDESPQYPSKNRVRSEGSRSHSLRSELTTPSLQSRRSRVYKDELEPQRTHHRRHHSSIPCTKNKAQYNGSSVQRTQYPKVYTSDTRSNSLIDLQSPMNRNCRHSKPRNQNSEREYYSSTKEYDPPQVYNEENTIPRRREQRVSRAGEQQMHQSRYSECNSNTPTRTQIQPQYEMSQPQSFRGQYGAPEITEQYFPQNPYCPPQFFQQNFTYTYPYS